MPGHDLEFFKQMHKDFVAKGIRPAEEPEEPDIVEEVKEVIEEVKEVKEEVAEKTTEQ